MINSIQIGLNRSIHRSRFDSNISNRSNRPHIRIEFIQMVEFSYSNILNSVHIMVISIIFCTIVSVDTIKEIPIFNTIFMMLSYCIHRMYMDVSLTFVGIQ